MRLVALLVVCLLAGAEGSSRRVKSPSIKSVSFTAGPVLHEDKFEEGKFGREEIKGIKNLVEVFENDVYESINSNAYLRWRHPFRQEGQTGRLSRGGPGQDDDKGNAGRLLRR